MARGKARGANALKGYVAMLRGINIAGRKPIPMERLRASFEAKRIRVSGPFLASPPLVAEIQHEHGYE